MTDVIDSKKILKVFPSFILGKCRCGCNEDIPIRSTGKVLVKYKKNHVNRGKNHYAYKGGIMDYGPYKLIYKPDHPNAIKKGYVLRHRLVYEHYLKILFDEDVYIPKNIDVHHIIPVKEGGTDALINLEVLTHAEHRRRHIKDMTGIICNVCGSDETLMIKYEDDFIRPKWFGNKEKGSMCSKCYHKDPIIKERATQRRHERMKDPIRIQKRREYEREWRKRKKLKINTLDNYSNQCLGQQDDIPRNN